jgi:hypothetical protein
MESLLSLFLLFVAATTAMISYLLMPHIPVVVLTTAAAIVLAAGAWWHWSQFSVDYRTSTWQEQLRNYASYAVVLVVILVSYGFYIFAWKAGSVTQMVAQAQASIRETGRSVSEQAARAVTATSASLFSEPAPAVIPAKVATPAPVVAKPAAFSLANFLS